MGDLYPGRLSPAAAKAVLARRESTGLDNIIVLHEGDFAVWPNYIYEETFVHIFGFGHDINLRVADKIKAAKALRIARKHIAIWSDNLKHFEQSKK